MFKVLLKKEKRALRSLIGQIGWIAGQTRPDLLFDYCDLSSRVKNGTIKDLFHANKVVAKAKLDSTTLTFPAFSKPEEMYFATYNDASFGNLKDGGSQGGFVCFLTDSTGLCCPIMWQSRKLRRIVKSTMASETLIQVEAAEASYWIANLLAEILCKKRESRVMPRIECFTDSNQLYDAVHSLKLIEDRRLRIDMGLLQEMIQRKEISRIVWVEKGKQLADSLTKLGASSAKLLEVIERGELCVG